MTYGEIAGAAPEMSDESVLTDQMEGGILTLTLHAPKKRNALTEPVRQQLLGYLSEAMGDRATRAIILTGSGRVFSAGGDISTMGQPIEAMMTRLHVMQDVIRLILRGPKPVIAAVNGAAFGAGWSLALACDWIICGPEARFSAAFARLGLAPDSGILWTLPHRVGQRRAMQYFIRANVVSATEAVTQGIADERVDSDLLTAAWRRATDMLQIAPLAIAEIKRHYADTSLDLSLARESEAQRRAFATADHAEAVSAFRAKRPAEFRGQ